jgi:hypothetical protein
MGKRFSESAIKNAKEKSGRRLKLNPHDQSTHLAHHLSILPHEPARSRQNPAIDVAEKIADIKKASAKAGLIN